MASTSTSRVVILIDMDCFYCQVEEKLNPALEGKPIAVVQYNAWRGGGIIAVNYPARDEGVTRHMRGNDAKKKCPSIKLVQVPELRGKADLTKYRDAGQRVADVLATFTPLLQRASVDEAYMDITELVKNRIQTSINALTIDNLSNTHVVGCDLKDFIEDTVANKEFSKDNLKLLVGGLIAEEIRREVFLKTGYKCSAGIAHNKILAKLVCGLHKPNKQTILPQDAIPKFFETMPIRKIKSLGGKFGQTLSNDFHITYMGELANIHEKDLARKYDEKTANWLCNIAKGIDLELVTPKLIAKSIACCKNFTGKAALTTLDSVEHWLNELAAEMSERLNKDLQGNNRKAKQIIISFCQEISKKEVSGSRTQPLVSYDSQKIAQASLNIIKKNCFHGDGNSCHIKFLGLSAGNFEDVKKVREITSFFQTKAHNALQNASSDVSYPEDCDRNREITEGSIYFQVTQELQENSQDLVFYDNSFLAKNAGNNSLDQNNDFAYSSNDDTEADMTQGNSPQRECLDNCQDVTMQEDSSNDVATDVVIDNSKPASFFSKYFTNVSPVLKTTRENPRTQLQTNVEEEPHEICPECQKRIPVCEFLSHQDYHFALKLSKNENIPPKPSIKTPAVPSKGNKNIKGVKRKAETSTLADFFKKEQEENTTDMTETCQECNKKIKVGEMSTHMDYHTAKKLQWEINSNKPAVNLSATSVKKKNPKTKNKAPTKSVISFFQPT